jgi:hypothetical protein
MTMSEENLNVEAEKIETAEVETTVQAAESAQSETVAVESAGGGLAGFLALKDNNPTTFYGIVGGVGAIVVTLLALGFGGDDEILKKADSKGLAAGQKYTLKSPNVATDGAELPTIRLVATPGAIAAFDDDENKTEECRKFPVGTNVTVLDKQEQSTVVYAKVQIEEGGCTGTIGWVLGINL